MLLYQNRLNNPFVYSDDYDIEVDLGGVFLFNHWTALRHVPDS